MENKVQREEHLYRAIKRSKPEWLEGGRPTSAMFKDKNGNSVDRDGGRTLEAIVSFMQNGVFAKRLKGVVELNAAECMELGVELEAAATEANPYHVNIWLDEEEKRGKLQALMLADISKVVYENPTLEWVQIQSAT